MVFKYRESHFQNLVVIVIMIHMRIVSKFAWKGCVKQASLEKVLSQSQIVSSSIYLRD